MPAGFAGNAVHPSFLSPQGFDRPAQFLGITGHFPLVVAIIPRAPPENGSLAFAGRKFGYARGAQDYLVSHCPRLRRPGAALVGRTFDPAGRRLLDVDMLNVVFVLLLTTAILGPV
jgi:hypothetical protein